MNKLRFSDTLATLIRQIFFEICKLIYKDSFFQKPTLGHFLKYQFYYFHDILHFHNNDSTLKINEIWINIELCNFLG